MRNPLKRYYGGGDLHFITFSCYRRRPFLGTQRARQRFVRILDEVRARHAFRLIGYVVMPEHVHLLVSEPRIGTPSKVLQVLKQKVSQALRGEEDAKTRTLNNEGCGTHNSLAIAEAAAFWQRRFYDFNVWSSKKVKEKLEYMHANPVKRKLVIHPKDWPWSSWSYYAKGEEGLIRIDPVDGGETTRIEREKEKSRTAPLKTKGAAPKIFSSR
jgi:putative transposase